VRAAVFPRLFWEAMLMNAQVASNALNGTVQGCAAEATRAQCAAFIGTAIHTDR